MPFDLVKGALIYNPASKMVLTLDGNFLITGYLTDIPTVVGKITTEQRADIDKVHGTGFIATFTGNASLLDDENVVWAYRNGMSVQREVTPGTVIGGHQVTAPASLPCHPAVEPKPESVTAPSTVGTDVGATAILQIAKDSTVVVSGNSMITPVYSSDQAAILRDVGIIVASQFNLFPDLQYERYLKHIIKCLNQHTSMRKFDD